METNLLFVIGPPRSGSTLLMRMLSSHSAIYSRAEPHLLTPLAHLGYYDYLDTIGILAALEHVTAEVTGKPVEFGSAVRAAQEVYAKNAVRGS